MLASAGFGDDARLAHAPREQDLPEAIVDLVRAGVIEVFAFEINLRAAQMRGETLGKIKRIGAAHIMLEQPVQLGVKGGIVLRRLVSLLQIQHQRHQRFGHEAAAIGAEMARHIRPFAIGIGWQAHACVSGS